MSFLHVVLYLFCLSSFVVTTIAQQPYVGKATTDCSNTDNSTSVLGYFCNGLNKTCLSYIIFRSHPPFSTVSAVSTLFAADPSLVSALNAVSESDTFPPEKQVIVPVTCSCSGAYSQANITYTVQEGDSYFIIANNTFQGLSTCQALERANNMSSVSGVLFPGMRMVVPIRCACPTASQVSESVNYLLSYPVVFGDWVSRISQRFGVDTGKSLEANELSLQNSEIFPFTTLLIPLQDPPSSADTVVPPPPPVSPPPPSPPNGGKSNKTWLYVILGVLAGAGVLGLLGVAIFCLVPRKMREREREEIVSSGSQSFSATKKPVSEQKRDPGELLDGLSSIAESLNVYKFQELRSATSDFSPSSLIRGSVYLGRINGDYAAIKKIHGDVSDEIKLLSKLNHFNLIRLSGFCFHDGDWYLVYEYAANGSLSDWIYGGNKSSGKLLNWTQRMQISLDVATGLNYLHNFTNPPYAHKDINSSNILLDTDFRGKIANFRLARSTEGQNGDKFVLTRHIEGTKGYMAPEYLENGLVSTKLDVYSFGVLLLEIVTSKEAAHLNDHKDIWSSLRSEEEEYQLLEQLIDPSLQGNYPADLKRLVVRLLGNCLKKDHMNRPSMDEIVQSLSRILTASLTREPSYNLSEHPSS